MSLPGVHPFLDGTARKRSGARSRVQLRPLLAGLCLVLAACGGSMTSNEPVSDFAAPTLQGLAVRDHAKGAEVVTSPSMEIPTSPGSFSTERLDRYPVGGVFTQVNGTSVRGASHFRDLMNDAAERGDTVIEVQVSRIPAESGNGQETRMEVATRAESYR